LSVTNYSKLNGFQQLQSKINKKNSSPQTGKIKQKSNDVIPNQL